MEFCTSMIKSLTGTQFINRFPQPVDTLLAGY
jgi:hypothetical protein